MYNLVLPRRTHSSAARAALLVRPENRIRNREIKFPATMPKDGLHV